MVSSDLTLQRFEYLTLDDIYHPVLDQYVHGVLATCTALNTLIFPFMIFVILKSSTKEMELYKHLLVIQIIFSYLFNLITFAWQPSLLWPLRQGYPNTWVDLGPRTVYIFFILEVSFMFNIVIVQLFLVFYRLAATYKKSFWNYIYSDIKVLYACVFGICVSTQIIVIGESFKLWIRLRSIRICESETRSDIRDITCPIFLSDPRIRDFAYTLKNVF